MQLSLIMNACIANGIWIMTYRQRPPHPALFDQHEILILVLVLVHIDRYMRHGGGCEGHYESTTPEKKKRE